MVPESKTGRLSDLASVKPRADWSGLRAEIAKLEPGGLVTFDCPPGLSLPRFRSVVLTAGNRIHDGAWKFGTRSAGRKLHCFLGPR